MLVSDYRAKSGVGREASFRRVVPADDGLRAIDARLKKHSPTLVLRIRRCFCAACGDSCPTGKGAKREMPQSSANVLMKDRTGEHLVRDKTGSISFFAQDLAHATPFCAKPISTEILA